MYFGLQIAATGLIFAFIALTIIGNLRRTPGIPIAVLLLLVFFGGAAALIFGLLKAIWSY